MLQLNEIGRTISWNIAKWIPDRSIFYLIKPKHDNWLFVDLAEFPCFYLNLPGWTKKCSVNKNKTILGSQ